MTIKTYDERVAEIPRGQTFVPEHLLRAEIVELREALYQRSRKSIEQQIRDALERMEIPGAQNYSAGELVELANLMTRTK